MGEPSGRELWRQTIRRSSIAMVAANSVAAVFVFVYLTFVVPVPHVDDAQFATLLNLGVFALVLPIGIVVGRGDVAARHRPRAGVGRRRARADA